MIVYTYAYDESYQPAMPFMEVDLVAPDSGKTSKSVKVLVDSGSEWRPSLAAT